MVAAAPWKLTPQELNRIAAKAMRRSLAPTAQGPASESPAPVTQGSDDARSLGEFYAEMWNDLVIAGLPPSEHEIVEADAELENSPWRLQQDGDGKWMVVPVQERPRGAVQQFSRDGDGPVSMDLVNARLLDVPDIRQEDDYSCILPGQELQGKVIGGSKAWYTGEAIEIHTMRGAKLSVTANHPVLTMMGFVEAGGLKEGQHLLNYVGKDKTTASSDNEQQAPALVENVFCSLLNISGTVLAPEKVRCGPLDFHGDAEFFKGDVQVVGSYSKLRRNHIADAAQSLPEGNFVGTNTTLIAEACGSGLDFGFNRALASDGSLVSGLCLFSPSVTIHATPDHSSSFVPTAKRNSMLLESTLEQAFADFSFTTDLLERNAGFVEPYQFVEIGYTGADSCPLLSGQQRSNASVGATSVDCLSTDTQTLCDFGQSLSSKMSLHDGIYRNLDAMPHSSKAIRFGSASQLNASLTEPSTDTGPRDAVLAFQLTHRHAADVVLDEIVKINRFHYDGPVYDFESPDGFIIVNNLCISNCGAACAMSVGGYFGVGPKTLEEWKKELGTDVEESTRPAAIVGYFRKLGCHVEDRDHLTINDLTDYWRRGMPVICCIQEYGVPDKQASFDYGHYVVVIGAAIGQIFVQDPSIDNVLQRPGGDVKVKKDDIDADQTAGRMMIDATTWMKCWHDQDADGIKYIQYGIAIGPPKNQDQSSLRFARTDFVLQFAAMRAPSGTKAKPFMAVDKNGQSKGYLKGQFIPGAAVDILKKNAASGNAAAQEAVSDLEKGQAADEATHEKKKQARSQRDISGLKQRLGVHPEGQIIKPSPQAVRGYRAMRAQHGELILHRLDELGEKLQDDIKRIQANVEPLGEGSKRRTQLLGALDRLQGKMNQLRQIHQLAEGQQGAAQGQPQQSQQPQPQQTPEKPEAQTAAEKPAAPPVPQKPSPELISQLTKIGSFSVRDDGMLMGKIDKALPSEARADLKSFAQILEGNQDMSYVDRARAFAQRQEDWKNRGQNPQRAEQERAETKGLPPAHPERGETYTVNTSELNIAPDLFQYKVSGIDPEKGITDELRNVTTWDPDQVGVIAVWRDPATGKDYVVNGHHRYELAQRFGVKELPVRYLQVATAREARAKGALINIGEGRGTAIDAAKFLRDTGITPEEMQARGISLSGKVAAPGIALAKLSDDSFARVAQGHLDEDTAVAVASQLDNPQLQDQLFGYIEKRGEEGKKFKPDTIAEMARRMSAAPTVQSTQKLLFGEPEEESTFEQVAELSVDLKKALSRERNDYRAVASPRRAGAVSGAGNVFNIEENKRIAQKLGERKNIVDTLIDKKGPIADTINDFAVKLKNAKTKGQQDAIKKEFLATAQPAIDQEVERGGFGQSGQPQSAAETAAANPGGEGAGTVGHSGNPEIERAAEAAPVSPDQGRGDTGETGLKEPESEAPTEELPAAKEPENTPAQIQAALDRYQNRSQTAQGGGLFGGEELQARQGFAKLPDQTPVVFTNGEFEGKTGKIVHDEDPSTGKPRIVAEVDGRPGLVPITPDAIEPLNKMLSWRMEGGGTGASQKQGGLFTADQFLPKRKEDQGATDENAPGESAQVQPEAEQPKDKSAALEQKANTLSRYTKGQHHLDIPSEDGGTLKGVEVSVDPSSEGLRNWAKKLQGQPITAMFLGGKLFAWDNPDAHHGPTAQALGWDGKVPWADKLQLWYDPESRQTYINTYEKNTPLVSAWAKEHGFSMAPSWKTEETKGTPSAPNAEGKSESPKPAPAQPEKPAASAPPAPIEPPSTPRSTEHPLLSHLSTKKPHSLEWLAGKTGMSDAETIKALKELEKQGRVKTDQSGSKIKFYLNKAKNAATPAPKGSPAKEQPVRPTTPETKPQPPSRTPPAPPKAPVTPPPSPAKAPESAPEWKQRLAIKPWENRAETAKKFLEKHKDLVAEEPEEDEDYNPGAHERQEPKASFQAHISPEHLSPESRKVVEKYQAAQDEAKKGRGRPSKKNQKILTAAAELSELRRSLRTTPSEDITVRQDLENELKQPDTDPARARKIRKQLEKNDPSLDQPMPSLREEKRTLADQLDRAIAAEDIKELTRLKFQRAQLEAVLQFMRTGNFTFAG